MGWLRFTYRFILLPSFAGFACCGCSVSDIFFASTAPAEESATAPVVSDHTIPTSSTHHPTGSVPEPAPAAPIPADPIPEPELTLPVTSAAYQQGTELASSAYQLSQSALSPDDWSLIASRWQRAADQLKTLDAADTNYAVAQEKIAEYTRNAKAANAKIDQLLAPVNVPLAATTSPTAARRTVVAASPNAQSGSQTGQQYSAQSGRPMVRVPIVYRLQGTPVVRVTFNGNKTYDMILDTGASRTLITRQMANELGVVVTEQMIAATASQSEVRFDLGRVRSIAVGSVTLQNAQVSIGDAVSVGLLGNDFLRDYDVIIRSGEGVVELVKAQYN